MNPQADPVNQAAQQRPSTEPPIFQAVGTLEGSLQVDENQRYQFLSEEGHRLGAMLTPRVHALIHRSPERLGQFASWVVYPNTNFQGELTLVRLVSPGGCRDREPDEFWVSGRVQRQQEGRISVWIRPNPQISKDGVRSAPYRQFRPFYLNLHGYLPGDAIGEVWRFSCLREGLHLEMLDAVKVKDRFPKPKKRKKQRHRAEAASPQSE